MESDDSELSRSGDEGYPVHKACREGDTESLQFLLNSGHSPNEPDFDLIQPLHEACSWNRTDCVKLLIQAGANVNGRNIDSATPLCDACSIGSEECVELLLKHGAEVNPPLLLTSPLHEAALRDNWGCCQQLVDAGASLNHTDCHFGTPLHAAVWKSRSKSALVLLKAGCDANAVKVLSTPLHYAAQQDDGVLLDLLLQFGADVYATDNNGRKASDLLLMTSDNNQLLRHWEANPGSLKHSCRLKIRRTLGPQRLKFLRKLNLPTLLYHYLAFSDVIT